MKKLSLILGLSILTAPALYGEDCPSAEKVAKAMLETFRSKHIADPIALESGLPKDRLMAAAFENLARDLKLEQKDLSCTYMIDDVRVYHILMNR